MKISQRRPQNRKQSSKPSPLSLLRPSKLWRLFGVAPLPDTQTPSKQSDITVPLKNMLIPYNGGPGSDAALDLALQMARNCGAHLTGMLAYNTANVARNIPKWLTEKMQDKIAATTNSRSTDLHEKFLAKTRGKIDERKLHWIDVETNPDQAVVQYARLFDLTVIGQFENLTGADELELHPDHIACVSGRPVLVVPKMFDPEITVDRIVFAWDRKRASSRAMFDAIQLLKMTTKVTVVTIEDPDIPALPQGPGIEENLLRHGIKSEYIICHRGVKSKAAVLLQACKDADASMLVIGAHKRSNLSEGLFSGMTTEILKATHLPVFLSH